LTLFVRESEADSLDVERQMSHIARRAGGRRGFVLITTAASLVGLLALVGMATDTGRMFVARNELQVFADEAAVAAVFELDGTSQGLARATSVGTSGPGAGATVNRWYFGTQTVAGAQVQFAAAPEGPYDSNPVSAAGYRFARVQVNAVVQLYFLPVIPGVAGAQTVTATAIAGQNPQTALGDGLAPFSPDAHDPSDPNFGFTTGQLYTLRWATPGQESKPGGSCPGDVGFNPANSSDRGFIDVGEGSGTSGVRDAIVNSSYYLPQPLEVGSAVTVVSGQKSVTDSVGERFDQDTDLAAATFSDYHGNGRRLFTVAVNDGALPPKVVGFGLFFLQPSPCSSKNSGACCAEYVGPAVKGSVHRGAGAPGLYAVQLVQ
jgi:Flp pilus assembly protein TadG